MLNRFIFNIKDETRKKIENQINKYVISIDIMKEKELKQIN